MSGEERHIVDKIYTYDTNNLCDLLWWDAVGVQRMKIKNKHELGEAAGSVAVFYDCKTLPRSAVLR